MKKAIVFSFLLMISPIVAADTFFAGYYGETATHPGIELRYQLNKEILFGRPGVGFRYYFHPRNHHGMQLLTDLQYTFGLFTIRPYIGGQLSIPSEIVYTVINGSAVSTSFADFDFLFGFSTGIQIGSDSEIKHAINLDVFARTPFNTTLLPQAGISYLLGFTFKDLL